MEHLFVVFVCVFLVRYPLMFCLSTTYQFRGLQMYLFCKKPSSLFCLSIGKLLFSLGRILIAGWNTSLDIWEPKNCCFNSWKHCNPEVSSALVLSLSQTHKHFKLIFKNENQTNIFILQGLTRFLFLLCLGCIMQCWIGVMRVDIFALFLTLEGKHSFAHH